jgi:hypothetical protein
MRTSDLTPRQHIKHLLIQPPLRFRVRYSVVQRWQKITDSREAVLLPLGVAFWAVFTVLAALTAVGK